MVFVDQNGVPFSTSFGSESPKTRDPDAYWTDVAAMPTAEPVPDVVAEEAPEENHADAPLAYIDSNNEFLVPPENKADDPASYDYNYEFDFGSNEPDYDAAEGEKSSGASDAAENFGDFDEPAVSTFGLAYAPYSETGCKTKEEIKREFESVNEYGSLRVYGTDCDQVSSVIDLAQDKGMKLFLGIFDIDQVEKEAQIIIDEASSCWECVHTISVGNELVNNGAKSADQVIAAMKTAGDMLRSAGYDGAIVTVDTVPAMIENPSLCEASDYAAVNCHAFFDGKVEASGAGQFVMEQSRRVGEACGGKKVVVTESGWPHQGNTNGAAVPSREGQQAAIQSLRTAFKDTPDQLYIFTLDDTPWKEDNEYTFGAEKYWGIRA